MKSEIVWGAIALLFAAGVKWIIPEADILVLVILGLIALIIGFLVPNK